MIQALKTMFRRRAAPAEPGIPAGQRVYAVGDIHGRADLFAGIIEAIETDNLTRGAADVTVILLGDLVDRGPDSAMVIAQSRAWMAHRKVRILRGNHEDMFLLAIESDSGMRNFLRFGGRETLESYPVDPGAFAAALEDGDYRALRTLAERVVPAADLDFMRGFEDQIRVGDYLFVHAGILPGVEPERQDPLDLHWIREPFLSHEGSHGFVVVHGHTITVDPVIRANRIGLDTGAYRSGRLTALGLEGTERWLIEASEDEGRSCIAVTPVPRN